MAILRQITKIIVEMGKVFCISNHKGGVGKTTTTASLSAALAMKGKKVLMVDLDPQLNLTVIFNIDFNNCQKNVFGSLMGEYDPEPVKIKDNLYILPAVKELKNAEVQLAQRMSREYFLRRMIEKVSHEFDYVMIDTSPAMSNLTINAFAASDEMIIPLQTEFLALQGVFSMLENVEEVRKFLNKDLKINGILPTRYTSNKKVNQEALNELKKNYGQYVYDTIIRENIALSETQCCGIDIFEYAPKSNSAIDYAAFCEEFLMKEEANGK